MQRRGFLKSLFAAAAGLSAAAAGAASTAPKPALPAPAVESPVAAIKKAKRRKKKNQPPVPSAVDEAIDLLKQCRVISTEQHWRAGNIPMMSVRYSYDGEDFEKSDLDRQVEKIVENAKPRSIEVSCTTDQIDHLGDDGEWHKTSLLPARRYEILVEWVGVNL